MAKRNRNNQRQQQEPVREEIPVEIHSGLEEKNTKENVNEAISEEAIVEATEETKPVDVMVDETDEVDEALKKPTPEVKETVKRKPVEILRDKTLKPNEKIMALKVCSDPKIRNLVDKLLEYEKAMNPKEVVNDEVGAGHQYDLFNTLFYMGVKAEDYNTFKVRMDVINLVFKEYSDSAYKQHSLVRFDYKWPGSDSELKTYLKLVVLISEFADRSKRPQRMKAINLESAVSPKGTIFTTEISGFIVKYYKV